MIIVYFGKIKCSGKIKTSVHVHASPSKSMFGEDSIRLNLQARFEVTYGEHQHVLRDSIQVNKENSISEAYVSDPSSSSILLLAYCRNDCCLH